MTTTTKTTKPEMLPADMIRELIHSYTTHEQGNYLHPIRVPIPNVGNPSNGWTRIVIPVNGHHINHPPLLDQLEATVTGRTLADDPHGGGGPQSKPAGRIDVLAFLHRIDTSSTKLAEELGTPTRTPLRDRLSKIGAALGTDTNTTVRGWWITARVLTQHDTPPYSPAVPCPNEDCEKLGTIRVRLDQRIASCTDCHDVWTHTDGRYQALANWCAWAAEHLNGPRHWTTDTDGYPVECTACLATRQEMAKRLTDRINAAVTDQERHTKRTA